MMMTAVRGHSLSNDRCLKLLHVAGAVAANSNYELQDVLQ